MSLSSAAAAILLGAVITLGLRSVPFLVFSKRHMPEKLVQLGEMLPSAIMAVLVVYCLKDAGTDWFGIGLPKLAAVVIVALAYRLSRNTLPEYFCGYSRVYAADSVAVGDRKWQRQDIA